MRVSNELTRVSSELTRVSSKLTRVSSELTRVSSERYKQCPRCFKKKGWNELFWLVVSIAVLN
jgi:hypothetical protein